MWAVAERRSTRNSNKDGWPLDCWGTSSDYCTLWGVEFSGRCTELVAYGEGKECHNPSGDNQELSFEASKHRFGYGRTPRNGSPSTSRSEENVAFVRDMFIRSRRKSTRQAARESGLWRHTVRTVIKKDLNFLPQKPHNVQELTPEDCDRRMEYGELMLGWQDDWQKLFENIPGALEIW